MKKKKDFVTVKIILQCVLKHGSLNLTQMQVNGSEIDPGIQ